MRKNKQKYDFPIKLVTSITVLLYAEKKKRNNLQKKFTSKYFPRIYEKNIYSGYKEKSVRVSKCVD